jgi:hypothetical protein
MTSIEIVKGRTLQRTKEWNEALENTSDDKGRLS